MLYEVITMYLSKEYAVGDKVMIKKGIKSSNGENDLPAGTLADVKSFGEGNKIQLALKDDKVITLNIRITSYNVCYTKLLRAIVNMDKVNAKVSEVNESMALDIGFRYQATEAAHTAAMMLKRMEGAENPLFFSP